MKRKRNAASVKQNLLRAISIIIVCILLPAVRPVQAAGEGGGTLYISQEKTAPASSLFYTDPNVGAGDLFFYTYLDGAYVPAYCMNFGKADPEGDAYASAQSVNELGYLMRHGYPNSNLGTYDEEARYATQIAVFMICGFDPWEYGYNNAGNLMLPIAEVAASCGWNGAVEKGVALAEAARRSAAAQDAKYAFRWDAPYEWKQNMVTPSGYHAGFLRLSKTSANPEITTDHPAYRLDGAEYTVYADPELTVPVAVLETGDSGNTGTIELRTGTYYLKETKASAGFRLSDGIIPVTVTEDQTVLAEDREQPCLYREGLTIFKKPAEENGTEKSLEGAEFRISYFAKKKDESPDGQKETADREWMVRVHYDKTEHAYIARLAPEWLTEGYISGEACADPKEALFRDREEWVLPPGRIIVEETKSAPGYLLEDTVIQPKAGAQVQGTRIEGRILQEDGELMLSFGEELTVYNRPEKEPVPEEPAPKKGQVPKTGDPQGMLPAGILCALSLTAAVLLLLRGRPKKRKTAKRRQ